MVKIKIHKIAVYKLVSMLLVDKATRPCLIQYKGLRVHSGRISGLAARRLTPILSPTRRRVP